MDEGEQQRIAIVGGGIAGLFCAYVLALQGKEVHLFEATDRLGGRIRSVRLNSNNVELPENPKKNFDMKDLEFNVEFGPMRIELESQKLLGALLRRLDFNFEPKPGAKLSAVDLEDFPSYTSPQSIHDPKYDLIPVEAAKTSYQLLQLAVLRIVVRISVGPNDKSGFKSWQDDLRSVVGLSAGMSEDPLPAFVAMVENLSPQHLWAIQTEGKVPMRPSTPGGKDVVPLFTIGFWNLLSEYLSHDALNKMRDYGTFFHLINDNPNAAEWLTWWLTGLKINKQFKGVAGGMETIVQKLEKKLDEQGVYIHRCWNVTSICSVPGKRVSIRATRSESKNCLPKTAPSPPLEFGRVILALPKAPLEKIMVRSTDLFTEIPGAQFPGREKETLEEILDSAYGFPLLKLFFVVRNRWWEEDNRTNKDATRVPTRELHYQKGRTQGSKKGLILIYTDRPAASFWGNYVTSGAHKDIDTAVAQGDDKDDPYRQKERLKKKLIRYLNENDVPNFKEKDIEWVGIRDWGRDPYGGGNHAWRPKRRYWVVMSKLGDLATTDGAHVHICGEVYSDYHGFMEGALRSSVYALSRLLDDPKLPWLYKIFRFLKTEKGEDDPFVKSMIDWVEDLNRFRDQSIYWEDGEKPRNE